MAAQRFVPATLQVGSCYGPQSENTDVALKEIGETSIGTDASTLGTCGVVQHGGSVIDVRVGAAC